jgi:hypothetical protein
MAVLTLPKGVTDLGTLGSLDTNDLLIGEGSQTVTTGLDQSGLATGIANILVQKGSAVAMKGATGAFLKAAVTGAIVLKGQGGEWYYTPTGTGCARIRNISGMRLFLGAGTAAVTRLEVANTASVSIDDATTVTNLYLVSGAVDALYKSTVFTLAQVSGGYLSTGRGFTTLNVSGNGQVVVKREDTTPGTPPVATTVTLNGPGAKLKWCGGNVTTLNVWGGAVWDASDVPAACTVGTINIDAASLSASVTRGRNFTVTYSTKNVFGADADDLYA